MPRELRNVGASVRAKLLARARAQKSDYQILLTRYALERLIYRLSVSADRDRFILEAACSSTRDLDLLGHAANDAEMIRNIFQTICSDWLLGKRVHLGEACKAGASYCLRKRAVCRAC